ncbi:MAG TPA: hypothetical protein VKH37_01100 [Ferruginibacter sp.]|nr:hypothetical protein [Ferruginibacter sp.]
MSSNIETGHAKNVANFATIISFCKGYGASYNPSKSALQLSSLDTQKTEAEAALNAVKAAKASFDTIVNSRQSAFKDLQSLSTRIVNALAACDVDPAVVADAKTILRKIRGTRAHAAVTVPHDESNSNGSTPDKKISTAQTSFDSLTDHLAKLIQLLTKQPGYKPNETDLTVIKLNDVLKDMQTGNADVVNAYTDWSNSRINRNNVLYNSLTGMVQTAMDIKLYVKSVFGASSPQFKQVGKIGFTSKAN